MPSPRDEAALVSGGGRGGESERARRVTELRGDVGPQRSSGLVPGSPEDVELQHLQKELRELRSRCQGLEDELLVARGCDTAEKDLVASLRSELDALSERFKLQSKELKQAYEANKMTMQELRETSDRWEFFSIICSNLFFFNWLSIFRNQLFVRL